MIPQLIEPRTFPITLELTPDQAALIAGALRQLVYEGRIGLLVADEVVCQLEDARTKFTMSKSDEGG